MFEGRGDFKQSLKRNEEIGFLCREFAQNCSTPRRKKNKIVIIYNNMPENLRLGFMEDVVKTHELMDSQRHASIMIIDRYNEYLSPADAYRHCGCCECCHNKDRDKGMFH